MNYQQIRAALDAAVAALADVPTIYNENTINVPAAGTPFIRTTLLPARPNRLSIGQTGRDELIGLYQVDLYYPMGSGTAASATAADAVVAAFPRTWEATVGSDRLRVTRCWLEGGRMVNNWYTVAVMLEWSTVR